MNDPTDPYDTIEPLQDKLTALLKDCSSIQGTDYDHISFCNSIKFRHPKGASIFTNNNRLFVDGVEFFQFPSKKNPKVLEWRPAACEIK